MPRNKIPSLFLSATKYNIVDPVQSLSKKMGVKKVKKKLKGVHVTEKKKGKGQRAKKKHIDKKNEIY